MTKPMSHPWKQGLNPDGGGDLTKITINIPREMRNWLELESARLKLQPWKLIAIALDNERVSKPSFNFPVDHELGEFLEYAYHDEAVRIYKFLQKFKDGLGRDTLLLFRHQLGIPDKMTMLYAIREGMKAEMIIETTERRHHNFMVEYPPNYTWLRARRRATKDPAAIERQRKAVAKLEKKLDRQKKNLNFMQGDTDASSDETNES